MRSAGNSWACPVSRCSRCIASARRGSPRSTATGCAGFPRMRPPRSPARPPARSCRPATGPTWTIRATPDWRGASSRPCSPTRAAGSPERPARSSGWSARSRPGLRSTRSPQRARTTRSPPKRCLPCVVIRSSRVSSARGRRAADRALRRDVALANRIIERFGLSNAFGHVSARIPGTDTFYFPTRRSPGLASAGELLVLDTEGKILSGKGTPNSELWIHARIYAARPDVGGVVHAHPPASICLTQIGQPHRVVHNQGGAFHAGVPEFERIGLIRTRELGDLLARKLGAGLAVMMRGHGITTALPDVRAATVAACMLEESAGMQLRMLAAAGGDPARIRVYTREEAESMGDQVGPRVVERAWEYYSLSAEERALGRRLKP